VLKLKADIVFVFKDIGTGPDYYPFLEVYSEIFTERMVVLLAPQNVTSIWEVHLEG
jgi:hypothetical protein